MPDAVLVTGGAGFIGSHLVDRLVAAGRDVHVLDCIEPQVHGSGTGHRNPRARYLVGSVLDAGLLEEALDGIGSVVHLAAQVGVGQSMYEMSRYVRDNTLGTAVLLEALAGVRRDISSLVVASSMSIYGEGRYACDGCGDDDAEVVREPKALEARRWEPACTRCGGEARSLPTPEGKRIEPGSVYAITKRDQEDLCLVAGRAYGIRTVALRFFNAYGPRQSLSNPYTGVAAIFASRLLNGQRPLVFEDGLQSRDFVHVSDVVGAIERAMVAEDVRDVALNVGTGAPVTVLEVGRTLAEELGIDLDPHVVGRFRKGDVRHCYADVSEAKRLLGYEPAVSFGEGMRELAAWVAEEGPPAEDRTRRATEELAVHGLVV